MSGVGYAAATLGGAVLGWMLCVWRTRRGGKLQQPPVAARPALERDVLQRSTTGYLVMTPAGLPLLSNVRATELGVLRAGIVDQAILDVGQRAVVSGEPIDLLLHPVSVAASLSSPRTTPSVVLAVVRSIGAGRILVAATDESAAQRMEAARRDFVANVSHELKTPVSAMGLLAEATVDAADDPVAVRRFAGKLLSEAVRLGALVNELIALSRLQGADPLPDLAVVEVDAVLEQAVSRVITAADNAGITVVSDTATGLLVRGDRALLVTALTNLMDNAINYSPAGTQVSISRAVRDGQVQISVTDRGVGIAPEYTERVFERFFRIDQARSRATGGTGLGLAIVQHVAANHGGTATVWSRPGTGSTFTLGLPVLPDAPASADPPSNGSASVQGLPAASAVPPPAAAVPQVTPRPAHRGAS